MSEELKPCPFCGGADIGAGYIETYSTDSSYDVFGCRSCGARFEDGSAEDWNTRAQLAELATFKAGQGEAVALYEAGDRLYNELRQWLATDGDPDSQAALEGWRRCVSRSGCKVREDAAPPANGVIVSSELLEYLLERYDAHAMVRATVSRIEELRALLAQSQEVKS